MTANRRYQVAVQDLRLEMFVVELDRPWLDTPFLLQGFLIDSQVELDTLNKYCEYVYVDLDLSSPSVADLIRQVEIRAPLQEPATVPMVTQAAPAVSPANRAAENAKPPSSKSAAVPMDDTPDGGTHIVVPASTSGTGTRRRYRPRADVKVSQMTRQRFRNLVRQTADASGAEKESLLGLCFGWMFDLMAGKRIVNHGSPVPSLSSDLLPDGVERTVYEEQRAMLEELPRARKAFSQGEKILADVLCSIRNGQTPELKSIAGAVDSMVESMLDNADALMWIARLREEDITTYNHGVKVALYLVSLGRHLGFPKQELAYLGQIGMLADIGKTKLPRALLEKPGMLSPAEFELIKQHVDLALRVLSDGPELPASVMTGIAQHHERVDGSGYPRGLKAGEISVYGKMAAIADSFAALITPRAYANALAPQDALMNLYEWSGTSFHEPMVEQFVQAIGVFPVGSMIELTTGEVGVVVAHNRVRRLEPKVLVLSNADKSPLAQPVERDLFREAKANEAGSKDGKALRIARGLAAGAFGFKLRDYYLDEIAKQNGIVA